MPNAQKPWPYGGQCKCPDALTLTPDGLLNSGRPLAGPLRLSTAMGVGPSGAPDGAFRRSDFGTDRLQPRRYDPIGTGQDRWPSPRARPVSEERSTNKSGRIYGY